MQKSLMERAVPAEPTEPTEPNEAPEPKEGGFQMPDVGKFVPPEMKDVVERVFAAGMKMMYAPQSRDQLQSAVQSQDPPAKKMAENVTGLLLVLDQQSKGGIPQEALFPAGAMLLGEAAEVLEAAGQSITQADYNDAALQMFAMIGQKLGATPEQIMQAAEQAVPGAGGGQAPEEVPAEPPVPEEA